MVIRRNFTVIYCIALIALSAFLKSGFALEREPVPQIGILYPPDKVIMEFGPANISLRIPEGMADVITAIRRGREVARIIPDQDVECFSVLLDEGINEVRIHASKAGETVYSKSLTIFRRSDLIGMYRVPPEGFGRDYFHMQERPECSRCHSVEPRESDLKPVTPTDFVPDRYGRNIEIMKKSTCYSCHNNLASSRYVHGPVAVWSCLSCHNKDAVRKYSVAQPDTELCFDCHREQKEKWNSKKTIHGPVNIGKCAICHSPHSAENPFNLHKPTWELCVTCHAERGSGMHILSSSFSSTGHPTRDKPDPVRIGQELSCASCHEPHASDFPHLWAFEVNDMFELCQKCHIDK